MPKSSKRALPNQWYGEWTPNQGGRGGGGYGPSPYYDGYGGGYPSADVRYGGGSRGPPPRFGYNPYGGAPMGMRPRGGGVPGARMGLSNWMHMHNEEVSGGYSRGYPGTQAEERHGFHIGGSGSLLQLADQYDRYNWDSYGEGEEDPFALEFETWYEGDNEKYCPLCDATCTGEQPWIAHIEGARHRRKKSQYFGYEIPEPQKVVKTKKPAPTLEELEDIDKPKITKTGNGGVGYLCELCKVTCQDMNVYTTHIGGVKHQKKRKANALWALGAEQDTCSICRINLQNACLQCENNKTEEKCTVIGSDCNHMVHECCMQIWAHNNKCPVCGESWKVTKKVQYCDRPTESSICAQPTESSICDQPTESSICAQPTETT